MASCPVHRNLSGFSFYVSKYMWIHLLCYGVTSDSPDTQFSQEWARRKVVVKHSINKPDSLKGSSVHMTPTSIMSSMIKSSSPGLPSSGAHLTQNISPYSVATRIGCGTPAQVRFMCGLLQCGHMPEFLVYQGFGAKLSMGFQKEKCIVFLLRVSLTMKKGNVKHQPIN